MQKTQKTWVQSLGQEDLLEEGMDCNGGGRNHPNIHMEFQETLNSQNNLEKENKIGELVS